MTIKTRKVDVKITEPDGTVVFQKDQFEVPEHFSERAATIMAAKYAAKNENSALDIIDRVVLQITKWGQEQGYFEPETDEVVNFREHLKDILINQRAAFNSPVWFNVGNPDHKDQVSACFILPVEDNMEDILNHAVREGKIFEHGSGAGINISKLRGEGEPLSNGGSSSGPLSFMKVYDAVAGCVKSGGKTRRAAKLVCMDADHPDIMDFIECKLKEEKKAKILIDAGIDREEAYSTVAFQNANHSIRVSDVFMDGVENFRRGGKSTWNLFNRTNRDITKSMAPEEIFRRAAEVAWETGDPGIQFDDRMNKDNPIPSYGKIRATNPCSEFSAVDNSSCNLCSLNLVKYNTDDGLDWNLFAADIKVLITAMDIMVDPAYYPTKEIGEITRATRPLGLGFTNLGAMLMLMGLPYDSEESRILAAEITRRMTHYAYDASIDLAQKLGSFIGFEENKKENQEIVRRLVDADSLSQKLVDYGLRNSQVTLLAPTGCLTGDSLLLTSNGLLPIEDLKPSNGKEWRDVYFDVAQENKIERATKFYINGDDRTLRVSSVKGHEITCTPKHKFRVIDSSGEYVWKKAKELKEDDLLAIRLGGHEGLLGDKDYVKISAPTSKTNKEAFVVDEQVARILGYYMGDGYIKETGGVHFVINNEDKDLLNLFRPWAKRTGTNITIEEKEGCFIAHNNSRSTYKWFVDNNLAKDKGNHGEGAASAFIPKQILASRSRVLAKFLSGLFEADGTVSVRGNCPIIELTTVSEALSKQVMSALESLSIPVKRTVYTDTKNSKGNRPKYRIRVASLDGALVFNRKIGFISKRKSTILTEALASYVAIHGSFGNSNSGRHMNVKSQTLVNDLYQVSSGLPNEIRQDIAARKQAGSFNLSWARRLINGNPQLEKSKIHKIVSDVFYKFGNNMMFVPVKSIEETGIQMTYDISVPEKNTYVANGFVTHNTISFMMDCDTTGIEPLFALKSYKQLAGGGVMEIVPDCVEEALNEIPKIHYMDGGPDPRDFEDVQRFIAKYIPSEKREIFATANEISWKAHIDMMAACQPYLNGAISKTINMSSDATVEDVEEACMYAWKKDLKAIAVYRDGCKEMQPLTSVAPKEKKENKAFPPKTIGRALDEWKERQKQNQEVFDRAEAMIASWPQWKQDLVKAYQEDPNDPRIEGHDARLAENLIEETKETEDPFEAIAKIPQEKRDKLFEDMKNSSTDIVNGAMQSAGNEIHVDVSRKGIELINAHQEDLELTVAQERLAEYIKDPEKLRGSSFDLFMKECEELDEEEEREVAEEWSAFRKKLPDTRNAKNHKFDIAGTEGYINVGMYDDGTPGEIFVSMNNYGSTLQGFMDSFATAVSLALQYGVPLEKLAEKFIPSRFEPAGITQNSDIPMVSSIVSYVFRWLMMEFEEEEDIELEGREVTQSEEDPDSFDIAPGKMKPLDELFNEHLKYGGLQKVEGPNFKPEPVSLSGPPCTTCGALTQRAGSCYYCSNCGSSSGCS